MILLRGLCHLQLSLRTTDEREKWERTWQVANSQIWQLSFLLCSNVYLMELDLPGQDPSRIVISDATASEAEDGAGVGGCGNKEQ